MCNLSMMEKISATRQSGQGNLHFQQENWSFLCVMCSDRDVLTDRSECLMSIAKDQEVRPTENDYLPEDSPQRCRDNADKETEQDQSQPGKRTRTQDQSANQPPCSMSETTYVETAKAKIPTDKKKPEKAEGEKKDGKISRRPSSNKRRKKGPSVVKREIRIVTINVRGMGRQKHKKDALCKFLEEQSVDVGLITETHMSKKEVEELHIENYEVIANSCRSDAAAGGVIILVHTDLDAEEIKDMPEYPHYMNICSAVIYPQEIESSGIRITGVYLSPAARTRAEDLKQLTSDQYQTWNKKGDQLNHLLPGDFNPRSWRGEGDTKFPEWMAEKELWELTDPGIPTHVGGSALDKVLL